MLLFKVTKVNKPFFEATVAEDQEGFDSFVAIFQELLSQFPHREGYIVSAIRKTRLRKENITDLLVLAMVMRQIENLRKQPRRGRAKWN
jgi:hypothetical protein